VEVFRFGFYPTRAAEFFVNAIKEMIIVDKKIIIFCLFTLVFILVIPSVIFPASFDCSKAKTKTEKVICDDLLLSKLDEDMSSAYHKALESYGHVPVKKEQRKWLKEVLSPCREDKACITKAYENRLYQLGWVGGKDIPAFIGRWQLVGPLWKGTLLIGKTIISIGSPGCDNLRYTILKHLPPGDQRNEAIYVIDVAAPLDKCRYSGQQKVIFHFKVARDDISDILYIDNCPFMEDLELFMQGRNRYCSGTFVGIKLHWQSER
jgi:uncharacterized protein YecT (DUF1311 family)